MGGPYTDHFVGKKDVALEVFVDLTNRGKFVTLGLKFGADFLAYENDPLVCHAKYLVKILPEGSSINQNELIASERIANQAKKSLLLAYKSVSGDIKYC